MVYTMASHEDSIILAREVSALFKRRRSCNRHARSANYKMLTRDILLPFFETIENIDSVTGLFCRRLP